MKNNKNSVPNSESKRLKSSDAIGLAMAGIVAATTSEAVADSLCKTTITTTQTSKKQNSDDLDYVVNYIEEPCEGDNCDAEEPQYSSSSSSDSSSSSSDSSSSSSDSSSSSSESSSSSSESSSSSSEDDTHGGMGPEDTEDTQEDTPNF